MTEAQKARPTWQLTASDPEDEFNTVMIDVTIRPSHSRDARIMFPRIIAEVTGFLATPVGEELLQDVQQMLKELDAARPKEGENAADTIQRINLPLINRIARTLTTEGLQVWSFIEDEALPVMTTLGRDQQDVGLLIERIVLAMQAFMWHWQRNANPQTRAALGKSVSATNAALQSESESESESQTSSTTEMQAA